MPTRVVAPIAALFCCLVVGLAEPSFAASPKVSTDPSSGIVTVTLADGVTVTIPANLASQVIAAMNSTDSAALTGAIKGIVLADGSDNNNCKAGGGAAGNLATAIYVLAANSTNSPASLNAAYAGVVDAAPCATKEVADNTTAANGAPGGNGATPGGQAGFPTGGSGGGGSAPSVDTP